MFGRETELRRAGGRTCCRCGRRVSSEPVPRGNAVRLGSRLACIDCARAALAPRRPGRE